MENLSSGFFRRLFSGEDLSSVTPILRVETPYQNGKITFDDRHIIRNCFIMSRSIMSRIFNIWRIIFKIKSIRIHDGRVIG